MRLSPPSLRVDPDDEARLTTQARALARSAAEQVEDRATIAVVTFTLGGRACAVEASAMERAVTRLGLITSVPQASGGARLVAWVDEQPVAVTDLAELAGRPPRGAAALGLAPALLLATPTGPSALAVEGTLELGEDRLALVAGQALDGIPGLRLAGLLDGGAALLAAPWLVACAGGAPA